MQYAYSEMSCDANQSRPKSMTYPSGPVTNYFYLVGMNNDISRLSYICNGGGM